jgi:hypothetical protein
MMDRAVVEKWQSVVLTHKMRDALLRKEDKPVHLEGAKIFVTFSTDSNLVTLPFDPVGVTEPIAFLTCLRLWSTI